MNAYKRRIMEIEMNSDYVSFNIESYYSQAPKGPIQCPMCYRGLSKSAIEPSKAMSKEKELAGSLYILFESSSLFVCNACHWWCVREHYEFADSFDVTHKYGYDCLIFCTANGGQSKDFRNTTVENTQPWLKALDDSKVYDKVQGLPEKLALLFEGGMTRNEYRSNEFSELFKKAEKAVEPTEVYDGLRNQILSLRPSNAGIKPSSEIPNIWGVLMEIGYPQAVVTLVSLADGTTSLYFSNGGKRIDGGQHARVSQASKSFVTITENYYAQMTLTETFPLPTIGRVKFYVLTYSGIYTIDVDEYEIAYRNHELSRMFYYGQHV
jgi:hypothetical protein